MQIEVGFLFSSTMIRKNNDIRKFYQEYLLYLNYKLLIFNYLNFTELHKKFDFFVKNRNGR